MSRKAKIKLPSCLNQHREVLILGCGYTAARVACSLIRTGARVVCTNRVRANLPGAECVELDAGSAESLSKLANYLTPGMAVLHSIPPVGNANQAFEYTPQLLETLRPFAPARMVYISSTGVYGPAGLVDEKTPVAPDIPRDKLRKAAEDLISAGDWSSLILRPAAIYGPGRGVHNSVQRGVFQVSADGNRLISRIHVDDLAEQVRTGLLNSVTGAFPIADEEPCPSIDIALLTARLLGLPTPVAANADTLPGRRVDGSAYRRAAELTLRYPSYRQGVPACLQ